MSSKTLIINFSHRSNSGSEKIAKYFQSKIADSEVLNYQSLNIPMWDDGVWKNDPKWIELLKPIREKLEICDSLIFVVPEYSGSATPSFFNFIILLGSYPQIAHKPVLLVTNSSSRGGAYPISQIKGYSSKNSRILYIPEHIIVRNNTEVLNEIVDPNSNEDRYLRDRIEYSIKVLNEYSARLQGLTKILRPDPRFENGM